jgi:cytochrome d ubiquinol oxidase subunit I
VVVPAWQVLFTLILFTVIYALLLALLIYLLKREFEHGPEPMPETSRAPASEEVTT